MYSWMRDLLFCLPPETSHDLSLDMLGALERLRLLSLFIDKPESRPVEVMGLHFDNAVGLAAGLDKNGDYFNALGTLGFGFVEVGTATPRPQPGNPQPRLFRLPEAEAIINRMGFNNLGIDYLLANVKKRRYSGILGINIGKNFTTPVERARDDYLLCMEKAYTEADYIAVNLSSPNTPGLRSLQFGDSLKQLLTPLKRRQSQLAERHGQYVPLAVKLAPDMEDGELREVASSLLAIGVDGLIATNTTVGRDGVEDLALASESGGLSGPPLREKSTHAIGILADTLEGRIPIIGVGGIDSVAAANEKLEAGASLVQIYTGFIYQGPKLVRNLVAAL